MTIDSCRRVRSNTSATNEPNAAPTAAQKASTISTRRSYGAGPAPPARATADAALFFLADLLLRCQGHPEMALVDGNRRRQIRP